MTEHKLCPLNGFKPCIEGNCAVFSKHSYECGFSGSYVKVNDIEYVVTALHDLKDRK